MSRELFKLRIHNNKKFGLEHHNKMIWMKKPGQVMRVLRALIYKK